MPAFILSEITIFFRVRPYHIHIRVHQHLSDIRSIPRAGRLIKKHCMSVLLMRAVVMIHCVHSPTASGRPLQVDYCARILR